MQTTGRSFDMRAAIILLGTSWDRLSDTWTDYTGELLLARTDLMATKKEVRPSRITVRVRLCML